MMQEMGERRLVGDREALAAASLSRRPLREVSLRIRISNSFRSISCLSFSSSSLKR